MSNTINQIFIATIQTAIVKKKVAVIKKVAIVIKVTVVNHKI